MTQDGKGRLIRLSRISDKLQSRRTLLKFINVHNLKGSRIMLSDRPTVCLVLTRFLLCVVSSPRLNYFDDLEGYQTKLSGHFEESSLAS